MNTLIIGCKVLEREINLAMQKTDCRYPVVWIESGLHNTPSKLTRRLQDELDKVSEVYDRVLLAFGTCGNALLGLCARNFEMIIPRVDDCITLLLGSVKKRLEINSNDGIYFLTKGWLEGEKSLWTDYQFSVKKYGLQCTQEIYSTMLKHYQHLGILDTGAYNMEEVMKEAEEISTVLGLNIKTIPASVNYLIQLLEGPWPEKDFIVIDKNNIINEQMVGL